MNNVTLLLNLLQTIWWRMLLLSRRLSVWYIIFLTFVRKLKLTRHSQAMVRRFVCVCVSVCLHASCYIYMYLVHKCRVRSYNVPFWRWRHTYCVSFTKCIRQKTHQQFWTRLETIMSSACFNTAPRVSYFSIILICVFCLRRTLTNFYGQVFLQQC